MNIFSASPDLRPVDTDCRTHTTIAPVRVLRTWGNVTGSENLTIRRVPQIAIYGYSDQTTLTNSHGSGHAGVLVDFGSEIHGFFRLLVWGVSGGKSKKVRVSLGESAMEALTPIGVKNTTNDHANRDMIMNINPWSGNETNESGFRFAYVELLDEPNEGEPDASIQICSLEATLVYRDIEYRGTFESSDPLVDKIYKTAAYTVHLNMQRFLWDGIKRDRLVWAGDMNTELLTILSVFGNNDVVPRSLDFVKSVTPSGRWMNGISSYSIWWLICHHDWYMANGDFEYLKEQKDYLLDLAERMISFVGEDGSENLPDRRFFDWPNDSKPVSKHAGLQGLLKLGLEKCGYMLKVMSESYAAQKCYEAAEKMNAPFAKTEHNPDCDGAKQAAAMLVLSGIADAKKTYDEVIAPGGAKGYSTFLGYYTLAATAKAGEFDSALNVMKEYWGAMLNLGATTFWEDFDIDWAKNAAPLDTIFDENETRDDIHGDFGAYCYEKYRHSLCHGWSSGPAPWLAKYVLGINIIEAGCRKIKIEPHLCGLEFVKGTYPTPFGDIFVYHKADENGKIISEIIIPEGIEVIK